MCRRQALQIIDSLLSRGGLFSMNYTSSLTIIVMVYGSLLEKLGVLEVVLEKLKVLTRTVGSLVCTTVVTAILVNLITASQYMSIVLPGRMFVSEYKKKDMLPQTLSKDTGGFRNSNLSSDSWNPLRFLRIYNAGSLLYSISPIFRIQLDCPDYRNYLRIYGKIPVEDRGDTEQKNVQTHREIRIEQKGCQNLVWKINHLWT